MKFGRQLRELREEEWATMYIDYNALKATLSEAKGLIE